MARRLLLALLMLQALLMARQQISSASASSFLDNPKKDAGTCSGSSGKESKCGDVAAPKKAPKKEPIDISIMWKKPDPQDMTRYFDAEDAFEGKTAQAVLKKLAAKPRVLEERCSQLTGVCYEVVDRVRMNPDGFESNKFEVLRQVQLKGQIDMHFGRATLVKPRNLTWKTYDTKKWPVNKKAVIDKEIQTLIGGLTGSKAIPRNETAAAGKEYQILLVGLGTPIIPIFIEQYHWIDTVVIEKEPLFEYFAKKWFGMRKHPNLRILHADPLDFMTFVVSQRHEFDAVLINVCKDYVDPRPCPADVYLERSTIDVIQKCVKEETGMCGVNTRSSVKKHEKEVASAYESAFPMCFDYPGDHKQLHIERYKSTICFNREATPFWLGYEKEYTLATYHDWFFYI